MQPQQQGSSRIARFFREAHRRHVFRVAALYIVGAWLVLQVADVLFPAFGIPEAAIQALVIAAVAGFPVAIVFGWMFDVGRHGIRRTLPAGPAEGADQLKLNRSDYGLLAAFAIVAVIIVYNTAQEVRHAPQPPAAVEPAGLDFEPLPMLANSIAVLPFANISDDPANEFFADGISEEILHRLSAFGELNVIGRTSSFAFKGREYPVPKLSALLGVRYLLQGSVRKAGGQVRVAAQLLDDSGLQVWSQVFDRELGDIFAIQSEIADTVAATVAPQVTPPAAAETLPDIAAYEHYLKGRELLHQRKVPEARQSFRQAIELDADFAEAYAELAITYVMGAPNDDDIHQARQAIDTALSLRPGLLRAHAARGLLLQQQHSPDYARSEAELRRVLAQDPSMSDALNWLGGALSVQGRRDEAAVIYERAVRLDPLHPSLVTNWAQILVERGEEARAEQLVLRLLEGPQSNSPYPYIYLRDFYASSGRLLDLNKLVKRMALEGAEINHYGLVLSYALFGDFEAAAYWASRTQYDFPDDRWSPFNPIAVLQWRGDYRDAQEAFERVFSDRALRLEEMAPAFSYWLGELQSLAGDFAGAIATLEPVVDDASWDQLAGAEATHALAWAYLQAGELDKAEPLLADIDRRYSELEAKGSLHLVRASLLGDDPYLYAMNTLLMGQPERALDRLRTAIDHGWRGYYIRHHDPRWEPLRDHPRFRKLMAKVKADVDAQHAEVRRLDAAEDFIAQLDAAMATRAKAASQ